MNMESSTTDILISLVPLAVMIAFLYFLWVRPLQRLGSRIDRLADAIERKVVS